MTTCKPSCFEQPEVWNKVGPTLKKVAQKASQHLKKALKKLDKFKDYAENVKDWAKDPEARFLFRGREWMLLFGGKHGWSYKEPESPQEKWETVKGHLEKVHQFGKETWEKYGAQFKASLLNLRSLQGVSCREGA